MLGVKFGKTGEGGREDSYIPASLLIRMKDGIATVPAPGSSLLAPDAALCHRTKSKSTGTA